MERTTAIQIMVAVALAACANMAEAQWTQYRGANGTSAGRSTTMGNTTYYYGPNGASAGSATRTGW